MPRLNSKTSIYNKDNQKKKFQGRRESLKTEIGFTMGKILEDKKTIKKMRRGAFSIG